MALLLFSLQLPPVIIMIDHLPCHSAIDTYIFTCDKSGFIRAEEEHHIGDIHRVSHPARRVLGSVRAGVFSVRGVDPARRDGIDADFSGECDGHGVGQCSDAAFCRGIAFGVRLAHPVAGG